MNQSFPEDLYKLANILVHLATTLDIFCLSLILLLIGCRDAFVYILKHLKAKQFNPLPVQGTCLKYLKKKSHLVGLSFSGYSPSKRRT